MIERDDLGSWINGAPSNQKYPGEIMGRPETGPGAIARPMRRLLGFIIDWYLCLGLAFLLVGGQNVQIHGLTTLGIFLLYLIVLVGFMGHTLGHFLVGVQVQTLDGRPAGWKRALIRAVLTMLVLPTVILDANSRGLHDRAAGTILVRIRWMRTVLPESLYYFPGIRQKS